jgi:allantoicase
MTDFTDLIDLAAEQLGGAVVVANDEFFAPKEAMLKPTPPEWREGVYTERGKWMDGWETRRRRTPGHDWAVVRLGAPGIVHGIVVDTSFFTGNYPERASLDAVALPGTPSADELAGERVPWTEILAPSPLAGNTTNLLPAASEFRATHLRLRIYPDGGVARLRVHGHVVPDEAALRGDGGLVDLAAAERGGYVVVCSDMHYGHRQNLILPGRSTHMGNGWETKRRRAPGNEWTVVRLAARAVIERVEVDTDHYKGNAPDGCSLRTCDLDRATAADLESPSVRWRDLVSRSKLQPHARHGFEATERAPATHVRLDIYPDGGIARLRLFGRVAPRGA